MFICNIDDLILKKNLNMSKVSLLVMISLYINKITKEKIKKSYHLKLDYSVNR